MGLPEPFSRVWRAVGDEARRRFINDLQQSYLLDNSAGSVQTSVMGPGVAKFAHESFETAEKSFRKASDSVIFNALNRIYSTTRSSHNDSLFSLLGVKRGEDVSGGGVRTAGGIKQESDFIEAAERLRSEHRLSAEDVLLLLSAVASAGIDQWRRPTRAVVDRLLRSLVRPAQSIDRACTPIALGISLASAHMVSTGQVRAETPADPAVAPVSPVPEQDAKRVSVGVEPAAEHAVAVQQKPEAIEWVQQTALDRHFIAQIVREVRRQKEDLASARNTLLPLLGELEKLDPLRLQTSFLPGLLDAMTEAGVGLSVAGDNVYRRSWYLAGFAQGLMRTRTHAEMAAWIRSLSREYRSALFNVDPRAAGLVMENLVFEWLPKASEHVLASEILRAQAAQNPSFVRGQLALAFRCRDSRDRKAMKGVLGQVDSGSLHSLEEIEPGCLAMMEYLLGELRRMESRFADAEQHYQKAMASAEADKVPGLSELVLVLSDLQISDVQDLVISERSVRELRGGLVRARDILERQLKISSDWLPRLLAALHDLLVQQRHLLGPEMIGGTMRGVVADLDSSASTSRFGAEFVQRIEAWAAIADLMAVNGELAAESTRSLALWLDSVLPDQRPPSEFLYRALEGSIACGVSDATDLAETLLKSFGAGSLDRLPIEDIARHSPAVASGILVHLREEGRGIRPEARFHFAGKLIHALLKSTGERVAEAVADAFDLMQQLAMLHQGVRADFERLCLREGDNLAACLDPDSRLEALLAVAQAADDAEWCAKAAKLLLPRAVQREDDGFLEELIELVEATGYGDEVPGHYRHRLKERHQRTESAIRLRSYSEVRLVYVGGNEIQQQYEEAIAETLRQKFPGIMVRFHFPGWTSNWHVELEAVQNTLSSVKPRVVVLSTLVRTQFGRNLRRLLGESNIQWRSCTGRGRASIERALRGAIAVSIGTGK